MGMSAQAELELAEHVKAGVIALLARVGGRPHVAALFPFHAFGRWAPLAGCPPPGSVGAPRGLPPPLEWCRWRPVLAALVGWRLRRPFWARVIADVLVAAPEKTFSFA